MNASERSFKIVPHALFDQTDNVLDVKAKDNNSAPQGTE